MSYSAGTLELSIFNTSSGEIANIDKMAKSLSSLSRVIAKIEKLDFSKTEKGFKQLATAITPFIDKIKEAETSLNSLYGVLQKTGGKKTQKFLGGFGFGGLGSAVTLTSTIYLARRLGRFVGDIAQSGADYAETLNLWEVAMGKNIDKATKFVDKLNEAYGVSKETLMNSQAIFKNMLGTLGDISDEQAYIISEGVTQMALDYASLYNVTFEQAMTKFQAALAGQVRPIRSVSGYDITETTIYPLYKSLGGEKTQRQLTITEKRLLAILAIFEQMEESGATGDLKNTMPSFANQSRITADSWKQVKSYAGAILTTALSNARVMVVINAMLIATANILEDIGNAMGAFTGFGAEPFGDVGDGAEDAESKVDELNNAVKETMGLLDIDKFRVLSQTEETGENDLGIDKKITEGFKYESIIEQVNNEAAKLADTFEEVVTYVTLFGIAFGIVFAMDKIDKIISFANAIGGFGDKIDLAKTSMNLLSAAILGGAIYSIIKAIECFKEGDIWGGVIASTIGVVLLGAFVLLNKEMIKTTGIKIISFFQNIQLQGALATTTAQKLQVAFSYVAIAIGAAVASFAIMDKVINSLDGTAKKTVSIISIIIGALATVLGVILAIKGGLSGGLIGATIAGLGVGVLIAGIKGVASKQSQIDMYASGASDIDGGTLFVAGEMGKTEAVYTGSNGKTNVANVQQMEQAFYNALARYGNEGGGTIVIQTNLDGEKIYENTTRVAGRRGQVWATVG